MSHKMNPNPWSQPLNGYLHEVALRIVLGQTTSTDIQTLIQHSEALNMIIPSVREHQKWAGVMVNVTVNTNTENKNS